MSKGPTAAEDLRSLVEKGRRVKWWKRKGTTPRTFKYVDHEDKAITGKAQLTRIKELVIPPAWRHVRISPADNGKLQAVGIDDADRLQYIYHPRFAAKKQRQKFAKLEAFGKALPKLREQVKKDLRKSGLPKEKVLALMLKLINSLYFRIGTDQSAQRYRTYGITTLKNKHLKFGSGGELIFEFTGKSHIKQRTVLVDKTISRLLKEISDIGPKRRLFHYLDDDGKPRAITPHDINSYLKDAAGPEFSSKDLRTWGATFLAAIEFAERGVPEDAKQLKKNTLAVIDAVAEELGNTRAVCRSSYIHPAIFKAYENGKVIGQVSRRIAVNGKNNNGYEPGEKELIKLLAKC